ncbi:DUF937 domain-containing protein [Thermocoleostomius sinensis]|jgi:hypothetical protein|uniref:DUF937 domain-containing protein n=1 Tax=Thermocoleostomius sinensis A174 TaxID=2016057 RepID=A0A9E8Z7W4_9CYAN|nr:DUF937 domain-containing protein [Thermocoleostomius sinensis]WAL58104.1 DUF937 domain-containing protein [Thermocoleostomius sinensis A174]
MGLFFDVLSAINNPNQQGSVDQLSSIVNTINQTTSGVDSATTQTALSALTGGLRSMLKQQPKTGPGGLESMLSQFTGSGSSGLGMLSSVLSPQMQQQLAQTVAQKTGLSANMVQSMLPGLITAALGFLKMGSGKPGSTASNTVLSSFLDGNRDGDVDLGDAFKFATRFLNPPARL